MCLGLRKDCGGRGGKGVHDPLFMDSPTQAYTAHVTMPRMHIDDVITLSTNYETTQRMDYVGGKAPE